MDVTGKATRQKYTHPNDDFVQAGYLYRKAMTDKDREHLIGNIVGHLGGAQKRIQLRQTTLFYKADPDYGRRVANGLMLDVKEVDRLANLSHEVGQRLLLRQHFRRSNDIQLCGADWYSY